jgi:hypothetical protein
MTVRAVGARSGFAGAGIDVSGGSGIVVTGATVRRTAGPQVQLSGTTDASLLASTLMGEWQLARLSGVRGTTIVRGNAFDMRRQAGEPAPSRSSTVPDPSALEIVGSAGVLVDANTFTDVGGTTSLMDGVRIADVRVGTTGAPYGARLTANRFGGGRNAVRGLRSSWSMSGSRVDSAAVGVLLEAADTVALDADTVATARTTAVQSTGAATDLAITNSLVTGPQRAAVVTNAARVVVRRTTVTGGSGVLTPQPALGALDLGATSMEVVGNTLTNARWAALLVRAGTARVDSNFVSRNLAGVRVGTAAATTFSARHNAIFDNDTLPAGSRRATRGLVNDGVAVTLAENWWGDPRGPMRDQPPAVDTWGDSATGPGVFVAAAAPIGAHAGAGALGDLRMTAGDGQTVAKNATATDLHVVRAVDALGRPLAGASVTFRVNRANGDFVGGTRVSNDNVLTVATDGSGFASARFVALSTTGATTITATSGSRSLTFTVTVQ